MTPDITPKTLKDAAATLAAARLVIGALRHYAPDDTMGSISYVLVTIAQLQYDLGITVSPEGNGRTDITARRGHPDRRQYPGRARHPQV